MSGKRLCQERLVLRMQTGPSPEELASLSSDFADILVRGEMETIDATRAETGDGDHVGLARIAFWFDRRSWARLRTLIDRLNGRSR